MNINVKNLLDEFSNIANVESILLAGSMASGTNDENSDYDIYIYGYEPIPKEKRIEITNKYFKYIEIANNFWEEEDDGVLFDGTPVELIYRNINSIEESLDRLLVDHKCSTGYSTCFWANILNSKILYDRNGTLTKLQEKYNIDYPEELKNNIIKTNYALLKDKMPAYFYQIEKALKRNDLISVNHRVSALLASYFDIIFAYNKFLHPGEKKLLKIIKENNLIVPNGMEKNILNILRLSGTNDFKLLDEIDKLVDNLKNKYHLSK